MNCNKRFYNEKLKIEMGIYKDNETNLYYGISSNFMKTRDSFNCIETLIKLLERNGFVEIKK